VFIKNYKMDKEEIKNIKKFKSILSSYLGIEPDDINDEDYLREDLHMNTAEIVDFTQVLQSNGYDVDSIDFTNIETVSELADNL